MVVLEQMAESVPLANAAVSFQFSLDMRNGKVVRD